MLQADMLAGNGVLCPLPQLGIRAGHRQRVAKHSEWLAKQPSALQPTQGTAADTRAANVRVVGYSPLAGQHVCNGSSL